MKKFNVNPNPTSTQLQELTDEALRNVGGGLTPAVVAAQAAAIAEQVIEAIEEAVRCPSILCGPNNNHNQTLVADE